MRGFVAGLLLVGFMMIGQPASAGDAGRTFVDQCAAATTPTTERDLVAPWLDICGGSVAVSSGDVPTIDIELTFAGDVTRRKDSHYQAHWAVRGCGFSIVWADGLGGARQSGIVVGLNRGGWLDVSCGEGTQRYGLPAEFTMFEGNDVRWSIPLTDALGDVAGLYQPGTVLTELRADAGDDTVLMGRSGGGICLDDYCTEYLADSAEGADVIVD